MTPTELISALTVSVLFADPVGSCTGDVNGDRRVDGRDLTVLLHQFGNRNDCEPSAAALAIEDPDEREAVCSIECMNSRPRSDLNDDRVVDGLDLVIVLGVFGCSEY